jgi:hypothetical protein
MRVDVPLKDVPVLSIKDFYKVNDFEKEKLIEKILDSKVAHDNHSKLQGTQSNFEILYDYNDHLKNLYQKFFNVSKSIFEPFEVSTKSVTTCWACVTNEDYYEFVPHNHIRTSTINSVYYLNIPKVNKNLSGPIKFQMNDEWHYYQPENDEIIIFPNYLVHDATAHKSKEWRISVNMEIICKKNEDFVSKYLDKTGRIVYNEIK